ncbi:hypothetical protein PIIN_09925 [Serendipita indica DSM 11827]|uniref:Uncharacterized protein n=1 Tax=Serendipita indica (strain DSM 11827) TaxID=1109443 RepID=G4TX86_SERID|nr:hypothetical protein PIIN_09925 [Serendipita indica DSM 11827]
MESSVPFIAGLGVTALLGIVLAGMAMMADKTAIVVPPEVDRPAVTANREEKVVNTIGIARRRLCDPTGLVYEVFEKDGDRAGTRWMLDGGKMFDSGSPGAGSGLELDDRREGQTLLDSDRRIDAEKGGSIGIGVFNVSEELGADTRSSSRDVPRDQQTLRRPKPKNYIKEVYPDRTNFDPRIVKDLEDSSFNPEPIPVPPGKRPANKLKYPWAPFNSKIDFLFAKEIRESGVPKKCVDFLLKNIRNGAFQELTFTSAEAMYKVEEEAIDQQSERFEKKSFNYKCQGSDEEQIYTVWVRDGMKALVSLAQDSSLAPYWIWHARKRFLHIKGFNSERIIEDPMNADDAWESEKELPNDPSHVNIYLILHSDEVKLANSTSLTPVSIRIANLPEHISGKNSTYGGNMTIGFIPDVPPEAAGSVRYQAMETILKSLAENVGCGVRVRCGDGAIRVLHPRILSISQDLKEQSLSAGLASASEHCPRCSVPKDHQGDLKFDVKINKRPNKDSHWDFPGLSISSSLSFDILHSGYEGLFGDHIWKFIWKKLLTNAQTQLTQRFKKAPVHPNLQSINTILPGIKTGQMHWAMLQQVLPLCWDLIPQEYEVVIAFTRKLACFFMVLQFKRQSERRLKEGQRLLDEMNELLKAMRAMPAKKSWNFPKMHQLCHALDDIRNKGPTPFLSCILGEQMNCELKNDYGRSNKKEPIKAARILSNLI